MKITTTKAGRHKIWGYEAFQLKQCFRKPVVFFQFICGTLDRQNLNYSTKCVGKLYLFLLCRSTTNKSYIQNEPFYIIIIINYYWHNGLNIVQGWPKCGPSTCFCGPWTFLSFERNIAKNQINAKIFKNVWFFSKLV